ncbi:MAG: hypothetical protein AAGK97_15785, partial [Bacteroidota bacterium]
IVDDATNVEYRVRILNPETLDPTTFKGETRDDSFVAWVSGICILERNIGQGWVEVSRRNVSLGTGRNRNVFSLFADDGNYIESLLVYNNDPYGSFTIPLSPNTAILSGCAGTINATDLIVDSSNPSIYANALEIAIDNYLCTEGFVNTDYDLVIQATTNSFTIQFFNKHNPPGNWIGFNREDFLGVFFDNGALQTTVSVGSGSSGGPLRCRENVCGTFIEYAGANLQLLDYVNFNFFIINPIVNYTPFPAVPNDQTSCNENTLSANFTGNCLSDICYNWTTVGGTILSDPTQETIVYDGDGAYTVEVICKGCPPITETICIPSIAATDLTEVICEGDSIQIGDNYYSSDGMYSDTLISSLGCDSIVNLNLTVLTNDTTNLVEVICEGDTFNGYDMTGMYTDTFPGSDG